MSENGPSRRQLEDLIADLTVERGKLDTLVESLADLRRDWQAEGASLERVDAAALQLQNLYTGIERCLVLALTAWSLVRQELETFMIWTEALIGEGGRP